MVPNARCVFCAANLPHARHMTALEAAKADIRIVDTDTAGTERALIEAVTIVTQQTAPSAPKE